MRSRYDLILESEIKSERGTNYPDIMTFPIQDFKFNDAPFEYHLQKTDIERPDLFAVKMYGTAEFDDIIFWLNGIANIDDAEVNQKILIPSPDDMEKFYLDNIR